LLCYSLLLIYLNDAGSQCFQGAGTVNNIKVACPCIFCPTFHHKGCIPMCILVNLFFLIYFLCVASVLILHLLIILTWTNGECRQNF
jgi:hypothetical protein